MRESSCIWAIYRYATFNQTLVIYQNVSGDCLELDTSNGKICSIVLENYSYFAKNSAILEGMKEVRTMSSQKTASNKPARRQEPQRCERPHFSRAIMEVAKSNLKEFESQSDEAFLIRADMDRKLSSL